MIVEASGRDIFEGEVLREIRTASCEQQEIEIACGLDAGTTGIAGEGPYLNSLFSSMTCTPCS